MGRSALTRSWVLLQAVIAWAGWSSLAVGAEDDCNANGVPDRVELITGGRDCNGNGILDDCDVAASETGFAVSGGVATIDSLQSFALGDVTGDGVEDLVVVGGTTTVKRLSIHPGLGEGRFGDGESRTFPTAPRDASVSVELADLDGDGDLDVVVSGGAPAGVVVLPLGSGGSLGTSSTVLAGEKPGALEAADLDGDGDLDVAVAVEFGLAILVNDGRGGLSRGSLIRLGATPSDVAAGDLDGDGDADLATANPFGGGAFQDSVSVLVNEGGAFAPPANLAVGLDVTALAIADLDGDGDLDLAAANRGSSDISILSNGGDGSLSPARPLPVPSEPAVLLAADVDDDGDPDLVAGGYGTADVSVLLGDGAGGFALRGTFPAGPGRIRRVAGLAASDLDGDGDLDLLTALSSLARVFILENRPAASSADCNRNGVPDECEEIDPSGACADCNSDRVPDDRDIELGISADADRDGVPDDCTGEGDPQFALFFDVPRTVHGRRGQVVGFSTAVLLDIVGIPADPRGFGVQGWAILIEAIGAEVTAARFEGTDAERTFSGGFESTGLDTNGPCDVFSAIVLSFTQPISLASAGSPHSILEMDVESRVPEDGERTCSLRFNPTCTLNTGVTAETVLTVMGNSVRPVTRSAVIRLVGEVPFHRGDVDFSGRLDITDAIAIFTFLFRGGSPTTCPESSDADDDGEIGLTDGILILNHLFLDSSPLPAPGPPPGPCGVDPPSSPRFLGCDAAGDCSS